MHSWLTAAMMFAATTGRLPLPRPSRERPCPAVEETGAELAARREKIGGLVEEDMR